MPPPTNPILRGTQESLDYPWIGLRRGVLQEISGFFRSRREPGQVKRDAAQQGAPVRRRSWIKPLPFQGRQQKGINRSLHPAIGLDHRHPGVSDRLKRPEVPAIFQAHSHGLVVRCGAGRHCSAAGIGGAPGHPSLQVLDLLGRKRFFGRHLQIPVLIANRVDDQAFFDIPRHQRRAGVPSFLPTGG